MSYSQAEMDAMLMEYAGEGIPLVAAAVGGATFAPYFANFLPLLLNKTVSTLGFMTHKYLFFMCQIAKSQLYTSLPLFTASALCSL